MPVQPEQRVGGVTVEGVVLEVDAGVHVPLLLLIPKRQEATGTGRLPVVVAFAQAGKQAFLRERARVIAELLRGGAAVCLPDLRGCGETRPADNVRGRQSSATAISATELMNGRTLVGLRLHDLRTVVAYLRTRPQFDGKRVALWGDSFAPANPADADLRVPLDVDPLPHQAEPLGGLLALLGALYDDDIRAVYVHGGLVGYESVLRSPFCYIPHDSVVPGALTAGDLADVAAALAPGPLRLEGLVDGLNRSVSAEVLGRAFKPAWAGYRAVDASAQLQVGVGDDGLAAWLLGQLKEK
jgi:hypothetical protein